MDLEWITSDCVRISIKEMDTSHIKNCIRYITKNNIKLYGGIEGFLWIREFNKELSNRILSTIEIY